MQPRERITLEPGLRAAQPRVSRHQPHSRCLQREPRAAHPVRARRARTQVEARLAAHAVPPAAGVLERSRRRRAAHRRGAAAARRCRCRARQVLSGFYLNELIITPHHAARSAAAAVRRLCAGAAPAGGGRCAGAGVARVREAAAGRPRLRPGIFESTRTVLLPISRRRRVLAEVREDAPGRILRPLPAGAAGRRRCDDAESLDVARRVLRQALDHCLEGRELRTRTVARSMARRGNA